VNEPLLIAALVTLKMESDFLSESVITTTMYYYDRGETFFTCRIRNNIYLCNLFGHDEYTHDS
jgi:hypothetical protein